MLERLSLIDFENAACAAGFSKEERGACILELSEHHQLMVLAEVASNNLIVVAVIHARNCSGRAAEAVSNGLRASVGSRDMVMTRDLIAPAFKKMGATAPPGNAFHTYSDLESALILFKKMFFKLYPDFVSVDRMVRYLLSAPMLTSTAFLGIAACVTAQCGADDLERRIRTMIEKAGSPMNKAILQSLST
ncbi:hypothetical protein [Maricaulis sp.]|uniref:hypothetical protein n=1 Tax=Maricaulis sp. TaxID=1486257 RepID=UPI0026169282|nr:hypothetical protein [Maricaulis sp.]